MIKNFISLCLLTGLLAVGTFSTVCQGAPFTVQILHASDFEGSVSTLEDAPRLSSVLESLKTFTTNTIIVSAGNNYIPGPFFTASADPSVGYGGVKGRGDILILNALGVQASAFANHEFDDNTAIIQNLLRGNAGINYPGTKFPYLSANLDFSTDSNLAGLVTGDGQEWQLATNKIARSTVITIGAEKIGIVGATDPRLRVISSPGNVGVSTNVIGDIQAAVNLLTNQGINKIVLLADFGAFTNDFNPAQLRDVDVVVGSHVRLAKPTDRMRAGDVREGDYPTTYLSPSGEPIQVVSTFGSYQYIGRLVLTFDTAGLVMSVDSISGSYATDAEGVAATGNFPVNQNVHTVITNLAAVIDSKDGNRFGRTTVYLNGLRDTVRTEETNLGDLAADANLYRARQTDPTTIICLKNSGSIRDSIGAIGTDGTRIPPPANPRVGKLSGEISQLDIENSLRFNDGLDLLTLTAQQLRDTMEWSVAANGIAAQFPQVAGMRFSFNPTNQPMTYTFSNAIPIAISNPGQRLRNLVVTKPDGSLDLVVENGELKDDANRTFRLVTMDFTANGGDNYFPLTQASNKTALVSTNVITRTFNTDGAEQKAFADYMTAISVYRQGDVASGSDDRIQNLAVRSDAVLSPRITNVSVGDSNVQITFGSLPNRTYQLQATSDLALPWQNVGSVVTGDGSPKTVSDISSNNSRFYRVVQTP